MNIAGRDFQVSGTMLRIARPALDKYDVVDDAAATAQALCESSARIDLFTFTQILPHIAPEHSYAMEWDPVAALPVTTFAHWWAAQINDKTRNIVRRAEKKGVAVREVPFDDALVQGISTIYDEARLRQGKPFTHYGKDLDTVRRENATCLERSIFLGAFLDQTLLGFAKLVCDRDQAQARLMQIISLIRHRDKAPTNALIAHAVRICAERGIGYLVYADYPVADGRRHGLSDFKRHNGFRRFDLPRYYLPLTLIGRAAIPLGLHRPLVRHLPESLRSRLRIARRRWYARRLRVAKR